MSGRKSMFENLVEKLSMIMTGGCPIGDGLLFMSWMEWIATMIFFVITVEKRVKTV